MTDLDIDLDLDRDIDLNLDTDIDISNLFCFDNTLSYGNGASLALISRIYMTHQLFTVAPRKQNNKVKMYVELGITIKLNDLSIYNQYKIYKNV